MGVAHEAVLLLEAVEGHQPAAVHLSLIISSLITLSSSRLYSTHLTLGHGLCPVQRQGGEHVAVAGLGEVTITIIVETGGC